MASLTFGSDPLDCDTHPLCKLPPQPPCKPLPGPYLQGVHPRIEEIFEKRLAPFLSQTSTNFWSKRLWYFRDGLYYQGGMVSVEGRRGQQGGVGRELAARFGMHLQGKLCCVLQCPFASLHP